MQFDDNYWMRRALELATLARNEGEIPIGAIIVHNERIIGRGWNRVEQLRQPAAHAEMFAIGEAAATLGGRRLLECTLYSTLEPCVMCTGAIVLARIPRLVYAAADLKAGACRSLYEIADDPRLNHRCSIRSGILADESATMLKDFFRRLRSV
ncbi:tRNA adenosine(34) deaminase TadA [Ignavibacteria bacterium]|nr:tRNA adenosine(34) deaminase TadA [Bacteroidota bacterium]MCZ2131744.1 tRNA adenosine(34) deaminase TadA [Bacteroidota bacterium]